MKTFDSNVLGIFMNRLNYSEMFQRPDASWPKGMSTLSECMSLAESRGYHAEFGVRAEGLVVAGAARHYVPAEVHIQTFYRFEGESNPDDMCILYLIETDDRLRGTLVDAYGTYSDGLINDFIRKVEDIHKAEPGEQKG